jgi:formylglycine-generating enzyme required for sulfatase activity
MIKRKGVKRYYLITSLVLFVVIVGSSLSEARPVRLINLPIEASTESAKANLPPLTIEERLFLGESLSIQLITASSSALMRIKQTEISEAMSQSTSALEECGARCPQVLGQLVQADLIISGRIFRFGQGWRLVVSIGDTEGKELLNDTLKGDLNTIEREIKNRSQSWYQRLTTHILKIAKQPLRLRTLKQASPRQSKRWSSLGISWIPIKAAKFDMGNAKGHPNERPVHMIEVDQFQIMKTEVTADQYWACVQAQVCTPTPDKEGCVSLGLNSREAVNCVTWQQSQTFAKWIGGRLPTEGEWELAAKSIHHRKYPWGNELPTCEHLSHLDPQGREGCGEPNAQAPCQYPRGISPEGVCDLAGNLWEWVEDDWHRSYHSAPIKGAWCDANEHTQSHCEPNPRSFKTYRGGSWYHPANRATSSARAGARHGTTSVGIGFRCVL